MSQSAAHFSLPAKARNLALLAAAIGVAAAAVGWIFNPAAFYRAYLHSWLLWTDVSLGCLGITMVVHLLGGAWGMAVRRLAEAAAMVLPVMAVLFIPIAIAAATGHLFPWADASAWQADPILVHRRPYLNVEFFLARAVIYGIVWIGLAWLLWRGSVAGVADPGLPASATPTADWLYPLSGIGLVILVLSVGLFASTDWILSLEPDYKSTVFGFIIVAGQGVSGLCALIATLALLPASALPRPVEKDTWKDLGSVLLTFAMLWGYLVICQFVVNWMGNDQEQVGWYFRRMNNGWRAVSWILLVLLIFIPLAKLLFRSTKRNPRKMLSMAVVLLIARGIDGFWMVNAAGNDPSPLVRDRISWLDFILPIGVGGAWVLSYAWLLGRAPIMIEPRPAPQGAVDAA
ncbi:MAG TPA: hypothetical protein VHY37_10095 [Tepidisphaeraceae bacterium]|jgi:hypothetical protein|nr:hypothetical protein [Tepidisphaeraceae bacterium]